ncbi:glycosyltransferase [Cyanobium sp. Alchichica 3B3-8F6]|uniref:glycosyltransferase n=1 Tax=Cyanobium sp. Alchichica 3B3-8F6 TaxID=2823696 RepID=UPI0020CDE201|nr:glycosyltransferase [Cyanobium sp. Alchichica 3B3-8F6]MCP9883368.1 glycosyltransferase [Cyanobium sp. Alchichica 3B3-8F6]
MTPKKKVLLLVPTLGAGGSERVIINIANSLDQTKFSVVICVLTDVDSTFSSLISPHVQLIVLPFARIRYSVLKIVKLCYSIRPDCILSTLGHLNLLMTMLKAFLPQDTRLIIRESSILSSMINGGLGSMALRLVYSYFYRKADFIICQSFYMMNDLSRVFRIPRSLLNVVYNPVDIYRIRLLSTLNESLPKRLPGRFRIVAAGRLSREKGFDLLVHAFSMIEIQNVELFILGTGVDEPRLKSLISRLGLGSRVNLVGFQSNPFSWFKDADLFVLSSHFEGFPNVVLEALCCATPVVASPAIGGLAEICELTNGCYLAESMSSADLAQSIQLALSNNTPRVPQDAVDLFSLETIIPAYERILSPS